MPCYNFEPMKKSLIFSAVCLLSINLLHAATMYTEAKKAQLDAQLQNLEQRVTRLENSLGVSSAIDYSNVGSDTSGLSTGTQGLPSGGTVVATNSAGTGAAAGNTKLKTASTKAAISNIASKFGMSTTTYNTEAKIKARLTKIITDIFNIKKVQKPPVAVANVVRPSTSVITAKEWNVVRKILSKYKTESMPANLATFVNQTYNSAAAGNI